MMINWKSEDHIILDLVTDIFYLGNKITAGNEDSMTDIWILISKATWKYAALQNI